MDNQEFQAYVEKLTIPAYDKAVILKHVLTLSYIAKNVARRAAKAAAEPGRLEIAAQFMTAQIASREDPSADYCLESADYLITAHEKTAQS